MSYQARRNDESYIESSNKKNANNIRNAANVAIATKTPAAAAGAAVVAADKVTGGKASDNLGKLMTKANQIAPGGRNIQDALNDLNDSGISDKIAQAAALENHLHKNPNEKSADPQNTPKHNKNNGYGDENNPQDEDAEGNGTANTILKTVAVVSIIILGPLLLVIMIFISATITYGNFEDGLGASYVSGESIGGFAEIEEGTKDAQDFYERINEVKLEFAENEKYFEATKIIAVYYVISNENNNFTYKKMTKAKIREIANAMFNAENQYDEELFKENLKEDIFKKQFLFYTDKKREEMAKNVIYYIEDYNAFVGSGGNAGYASSGPYSTWKQYQGPWVNVKLGNSGKSIQNIGCAATSVAILIAKSGVPTTVELNPGTFVEKMSANGGFGSGSCLGCINWAKASVVAPSFKYAGRISVAGYSREQKLSTLRTLLNSGKYVVAEVKGNTGEHWVAVDAIQGNNVLMMDPGSSSTNMWERYPWQNTSIYVYYST